MRICIFAESDQRRYNSEFQHTQEQADGECGHVHKIRTNCSNFTRLFDASYRKVSFGSYSADTACTQEFCKEAKLSTRRENTDAKTNQIRHLSNRQREKKTGANSGTINKRDTAIIAFSFKTRTLGLRLAIGLHLDASRVSPQSTHSRCHRRRRH